MALFGKKDREKKTAISCSCGDCGVQSVSTDKTAKSEEASVKVLGSGCAKCNALEAATKTALEALGMDSRIDHVTDYAQIATYGVMSTPALVIDNKVVSHGKVLSADEVTKLIRKARG
ncbi:MAG: thioredoxin family protein [Ruminococcaceae bacterium]|nr:thioredoxin family protein [Oscillospiraceae bacterium]